MNKDIEEALDQINRRLDDIEEQLYENKKTSKHTAITVIDHIAQFEDEINEVIDEFRETAHKIKEGL